MIFKRLTNSILKLLFLDVGELSHPHRLVYGLGSPAVSLHHFLGRVKEISSAKLISQLSKFQQNVCYLFCSFSCLGEIFLRENNLF